MTQVALRDRAYELAATDSAYAGGVVAKSRCAVHIDYAHLADAFAAPSDSLGQGWEKTLDSNYERHVRVVCDNGHVLTSFGLLRFIMATNAFGEYGDPPEPKCPSCGIRSCFLFYDPAGFPDL